MRRKMNYCGILLDFCPHPGLVRLGSSEQNVPAADPDFAGGTNLLTRARKASESGRGTRIGCRSGKLQKPENARSLGWGSMPTRIGAVIDGVADAEKSLPGARDGRGISQHQGARGDLQCMALGEINGLSGAHFRNQRGERKIEQVVIEREKPS